jgi:multidrug resistance protein
MTKKTKILIGVSAAAFLGPFTQTVYTPSLPELGSFFQVNTVMANLTISLFTAILALSNFVVGPIADRRGRRAILLPGLVVFTFGSVICLFSASYWLFLTGRAVQAIGISTALLMAPTVIGDIYSPQERAHAMGVFQTVTFLGPVLGPVAGGLIAAFLHWQWAFALLATGGVAAWLYNRSELRETLPHDVIATRVSLHLFRKVLANRSAFSIIVLGFSQFYGYYVFLVFLPSLLLSLFALPTSSEGFFFVPLTAGMLLGINIGSRWQRYWTRTKIVGISSFGIALNVLLFWSALSASLVTVPLLVVILLVYGVLLGCSLPVQSTILVNLFDQEKATAVGVYNFFRFTGAAIGPLAGGLIEMAYGLKVVFLSLGVILLVSAWIVHKQLSDPFEATNAS